MKHSCVISKKNPSGSFLKDFWQFSRRNTKRSKLYDFFSIEVTNSIYSTGKRQIPKKEVCHGFLKGFIRYLFEGIHGKTPEKKPWRTLDGIQKKIPDIFKHSSKGVMVDNSNGFLDELCGRISKGFPLSLRIKTFY